nr:MAG TPA: hypothetical protein [Caudoviricetes sp.]
MRSEAGRAQRRFAGAPTNTWTPAAPRGGT